VRKNPSFQDEEKIASSWNAFCTAVQVLNRELARTVAYIAGPGFTCADIVIGLSIHRWKSIPLERPNLREVERYYSLLCEREGFRLYGRDGGL
jgi:glutathione S-transferase